MAHTQVTFEDTFLDASWKHTTTRKLHTQNKMEHTKARPVQTNTQMCNTALEI